MSLTLRKDLDLRDVVFDHDFIFKRHAFFDLHALITRYRGTVCTPADHGVIVTAWQKSIYRFGGIPLEEIVVATIMVRHDGVVHGMSLDERSHGGLGPLCDFRQLQRCMNRMLRGKRFADFLRICPTAGDANCLHLFEVISAAASFYAHLREKGLEHGSEEELLNIRPKRDAIVSTNERIVLGQEQTMETVLRHVKRPVTKPPVRIPEQISSVLSVRCDGRDAMSEHIEARDFRSVYGQMNRVLAKVNRLEKETFRVKGRMRFTNATSFVGLMLLTLAHTSMHWLRAPRILLTLNYLQAGGARPGCVAFCSIQKPLKILKKLKKS